jgi:hypothetical protein
MIEIITVSAQISALTFILTSMLAMGYSLMVKQIIDQNWETVKMKEIGGQ